MKKNLQQRVWYESVSALWREMRAMPWHVWMKCLVKAGIILAAVSYVFYRSWLVMAAFPLTALWCLKQGNRDYKDSCARLLTGQFMDMILSVSAGLQTGYSVENAFLEAEKELSLLHGSDCTMAEELKKIRLGIQNGISLEQQLLRFGNHCSVEEIRDFTEVFAVIKRSGGNLREMIRRTIDLTAQRLEVEQEIEQLLLSRRFELKIMNVIPFAMYGYVDLTSPGFFDALYHNPAGLCVMTICLGIYLTAVICADRLLQIRV